MGLGLQVASGRRPLILVGDGAFQMTGWELGNARRLGLNPIVLLFNNAWGMLKVFQSGTHYNDLEDWRFADMAPSLGGKGVRVTTRSELAAAHAAVHADAAHWHLIEIMIPHGLVQPHARALRQSGEAAQRAREGLERGGFGSCLLLLEQRGGNVGKGDIP